MIIPSHTSSKAIFHWAEFSVRSDIFLCLKTNWWRVGVKSTKENIILHGKFCLVENDPKTISDCDFIPFHPIRVNAIVTPFLLD